MGGLVAGVKVGVSPVSNLKLPPLTLCQLGAGDGGKLRRLRNGGTVEENRKVSGLARRAGLVRAGGVAVAVAAALALALGGAAGSASAAASSCPTAASGAASVTGQTCGPVKGNNSVRWQ